MVSKIKFNKTRLFTAVCCFILGMALILSGAFLLNNKTVDSVKGETNGFEVVYGAAIRYKDDVPGIRFQARVTEEQYNAWTQKYGSEDSFNFFMTIKVDNLMDKNGELGSKTYEPIVCAGNIHKHNFEKGDFIVNGAVFLDKVWEDNSPKTSVQIANMYADAEFSVIGISMGVDGQYENSEITVKEGTTLEIGDVSTGSKRTIRSVAAALYVKELETANLGFQKNYLVDSLGYLPSIVNSNERYFYDMSTDSVTFTVEGVDNLTGSKVFFGAQDVTDKATIDHNEITVADAGKVEKKGVYTLFVDNGTNIYSFNNIIGVTKIIYTAEEFKEIFTLGKDLSSVETGSLESINSTALFDSARNIKQDENHKFVETVTDDFGNTYSVNFYGKSPEIFRGYYVLGADISFGATDFGSHNYYAQIVDDGKASGTHVNVPKNLNGLFGFGGTFDGNGHVISDLNFIPETNSVHPQGLFGALAYGAEIKNVAIKNIVTDIAPYKVPWSNHSTDPEKYPYGVSMTYGGEHHRSTTIIATYVGDSSVVADENVSNFLNAKYGTTETISIKDMYVKINDSELTPEAREAFGSEVTDLYQYENGTKYSQPKFYTVKGAEIEEKNGAQVSGTLFNPGVFGLVYYMNEECGKIENVMLELPNPGVTNFSSTDYVNGIGFFYNANKDKVSLNGGIENCFIISPVSNKDNSKGMVTPLYRTSGNFKREAGNDKIGTRVYNDATSNWHILATNDFINYFSTNENYNVIEANLSAGLDGTWTYEKTTQGNVRVQCAHNVYRYDSIDAMALDSNLDLSKLNSAMWDISGNKAVWKNNSEGFKVNLVNQDGNSIFVKDDEVTVTATFDGVDVTSSLTISADKGFTVNDNVFTCDANGSGKVRVSYNASGVLYENVYTIIIDSVFNAPVYVSSKEGTDTVYSETFALQGKNLIQKPIAEIYKTMTGHEDATISNIYKAVGKDYTLLNKKTVSDEIKLDLSDISEYSNNQIFILEGNYGKVRLADVNLVTRVIDEIDDFNYVPSTAETRKGTYVLAKDFNLFDMNGDGVNEYNVNNQPLKRTGVQQGTTYIRNVGYSFGSGTEAFLGTIDGLGHTINHLEVHTYGILGQFNAVTEGATLKNITFKNVTTTPYYYTGATTVISNVEKPVVKLALFEQILFRDGFRLNDVQTEYAKVNVNNVVIEMSETKSEFSEISNYRDAVLINGTNTTWTPRFCFVFSNTGNTLGVRYPRFNFDDCVFKYKTLVTVGKDTSFYGGGCFYSTANESYENAGDWLTRTTFADCSNLNFVIEEHPYKVIPAIVALAAGNAYGIRSGFAQNDFDTVRPAGTTLKSNNRVVAEQCYFGLDAENKWVVSTNSEDERIVTKIAYRAGNSQEIGKLDNFYRYTSYESMATAGKTVVGNFAVSASGITWNK